MKPPYEISWVKVHSLFFACSATVFWSHVQLESVNKLFTNLIENGGGGDDQGAAFRKTEAKEKGIWPKKSVWLDMFSLRQNAQGGDFDAAEMLELIGSIGHVSATAGSLWGHSCIYLPSYMKTGSVHSAILCRCARKKVFKPTAKIRMPWPQTSSHDDYRHFLGHGNASCICFGLINPIGRSRFGEK